MTKQKIRFVIFLMSVSLAALISFQVYWISNAISLQKEKFNQSIYDALSHVVQKLEQAETIFYLADQTRQIFHHDTVPAIVFKEEEQIVKKFRFSDSIVADHRKIYKIQSPITHLNKSFPLRYEKELVAKDSFLLDIEPDVDKTLDSLQLTIKESLGKISHQEKMIKQVMKNVLKPNINIESRISEALLRKYINDELIGRGIDLNYSLGVYGEGEDKILFANSSNMEYLRRTDFKVQLFPNDIFASKNFLLIYFSDKYSFLIRKMWMLLIASVLLVSIIVYCFVYAILTLIKQKKLSEMKNDFINNMTHEFKTPIATIGLTCEALTDKDINRNEGLIQRYISIIKDENRRLSQHVEKVLQIASLDKNDFKLNLKHLNIHTLIESAVANIIIQIENKNGIISSSFLATKTNVYADELHLTNIINNLLDNAIKYSTEAPVILVKTLDTDKGILVIVKDNGIGISREHQQKIFDKFYRVPTGNIHDVKGFGLGLAYVRTMVEAHGGTIAASSEIKKGSEFRIFLPSV